jgi:hypothetical protein
MKYTYEETCAICDKIAHYTNIVMNKMIAHFEIIGTAKAAASLASQGYHEEAKALMMQLKELKSK